VNGGRRRYGGDGMRAGSRQPPGWWKKLRVGGIVSSRRVRRRPAYAKASAGKEDGG
jgi:hypothetical protein